MGRKPPSKLGSMSGLPDFHAKTRPKPSKTRGQIGAIPAFDSSRGFMAISRTPTHISAARFPRTPQTPKRTPTPDQGIWITFMVGRGGRHHFDPRPVYAGQGGFESGVPTEPESLTKAAA